MPGPFQSTAGPKAGRHGLGRHLQRRRIPGFNPQPARKPAATAPSPTGCPGWWSFNPQPGRKPAATTGFNQYKSGGKGFQSTAGPKAGRHRQGQIRRQVRAEFQSTAGPKAGRHPHATTRTANAGGFQSTAGPKAGRHLEALELHVHFLVVSIHSRPESRPPRRDRVADKPPPKSFNPQPARKPAATLDRAFISRQESLFQSTAGPKAGRHKLHLCLIVITHLFQSTAGPKAGRHPRAGAGWSGRG